MHHYFGRFASKMTFQAIKQCYSHLSLRSFQPTFWISYKLASISGLNNQYISTMTSHVRFQGEVSSPGSVRASHQNWSSPNLKINTDITDPVELARSVFLEGLKNVVPSRLITSQVQLQGSLLQLQDSDNTTIDLSHFNKKYIVGFGKACLPMAEGLLELLNGLVDRCIISVPLGSRNCRNNSVEVYRGAKDNIPDEDSFTASKQIVELVQSCTSNDLLIVLISGGGSALLPYPRSPITLEEKKILIKKLSKAGCTINEMNTVRKRLSRVKGGGLVQMCNAKRIVSLIISDVLGSPLDIIASGPTVQNFDSPHAAFDVIVKYGLGNDITPHLANVLRESTEEPNARQFERVTNFIIGDNELALEAAARAAAKLGLHPFIITSKMAGEAADVGYDLATLAEAFAYCMKQGSNDGSAVKPTVEAILRIFRHYKWSTQGVIPEIFEEHTKPSRGVCLLFGGETTVTVRGNGKGGRNQEMALSSGIRLDISRNLPHVKNKVAILCAGTDGFDGPNNATGAVIEDSTIHNAQIQGISPLQHIKNNDSYNFFYNVAGGKYHIVCGHTETNVMDISIVIILKKETQRVSVRRKSLL